jgi:hypothetical protein
VLKKFIFLLPVCASVLPGCMTTPPLQEATGVENGPPNIFIKDVVQRIKCELSEAFDKKIEEPGFFWLANWSAHTDLTLQINDTAGVAPNGSYTNYLGKSTAANTASVHGKPVVTEALQTVTNTFSLSASANLSGQAVRAETVSFTIALDELKMWRKHIDKIEAGLPPEKRSCNFPPSIGVTGNLGLKDWVDSAFFPAETGQLQAGIHAQPAGAKPTSTQGPKTVSAEKAAAVLSDDEKRKKVAAWQSDLAGLQEKTQTFAGTITTATNQINTADTAIKNNIENAKQFRYVLAPYLQARYAKVSDNIKVYLKSVELCSTYEKDLNNAVSLANSMAKPGAPLDQYDNLENLMTTEIDLDGKTDAFFNTYSKCVTKLQKQGADATILPSALPDHVDPPIDSVLHSVNFVVSYGAGISPSWSLLQWKGPGAGNTPLLSASGQRTHTLNITLGPKSGEPAISQNALRLITDQTIRNIGVVPGG